MTTIELPHGAMVIEMRGRGSSGKSTLIGELERLGYSVKFLPPGDTVVDSEDQDLFVERAIVHRHRAAYPQKQSGVAEERTINAILEVLPTLGRATVSRETIEDQPHLQQLLKNNGLQAVYDADTGQYVVTRSQAVPEKISKE